MRVRVCKSGGVWLEAIFFVTCGARKSLKNGFPGENGLCSSSSSPASGWSGFPSSPCPPCRPPGRLPPSLRPRPAAHLRDARGARGAGTAARSPVVAAAWKCWRSRCLVWQITGIPPRPAALPLFSLSLTAKCTVLGPKLDPLGQLAARGVYFPSSPRCKGGKVRATQLWRGK